jgi:hypothetical protein
MRDTIVPSASATVRYIVSAEVWSSDCAAAVVGKPRRAAAAEGGTPGGTLCAARLMLSSWTRCAAYLRPQMHTCVTARCVRPRAAHSFEMSHA